MTTGEKFLPASRESVWHIETLTTLSQLHEKQDQWLALERDCIDPQAAFQSYAWCESWTRQYCAASRSNCLRIFCIHKNQELVAILPMMVATHGSIKTLTLLGEPHSQIANAITKSGMDCSDGLRLCLSQLRQLAEVDVITLGPIPNGSPLSKVTESQHLSPDPAEHMSLVDWPGVWRKEDYLAALKKNRRKDFGKKLRRLKQTGKVTFTRYDASHDEFSPLITLAVEWKRDWLRRNGMVSAGLDYPQIEDFLAGSPQIRGGYHTEIEALNVNGQAAAICINVVGKHMCHCYLSAYDMAYADASPGTLIHQHSIQACIENGDTAYNFLGYPTHFKRMWTTQTVELRRLQLPLTPKGKAWVRLWVNGLRPLAKKALLSTRSVILLPALVRSMRQLSLAFALTNTGTEKSWENKRPS